MKQEKQLRSLSKLAMACFQFLNKRNMLPKPRVPKEILFYAPINLN